jgi:hypothetical protein
VSDSLISDKLNLGVGGLFQALDSSCNFDVQF